MDLYLKAATKDVDAWSLTAYVAPPHARSERCAVSKAVQRLRADDKR